MNEDIFSDQDLTVKPSRKAVGATLAILVVALLFVFPFFMISSASSSYTAKEAPAQDFTWVVYPIFFIAGFFMTKVAEKFVNFSKSDFALALSLGGTLLIYISLLLLLFLTPFVQNIGNANFDDSLRYGWIIRIIIFGIVGIGMAVIGNRLNANRAPLSAILSFVAIPTFFLSGIFVLGLGIRDLIMYKTPTWANIPLTPEERFGWIVTVLLLFLLTAGGTAYLWKKIGKKALNSFFYSLKIAGWVYIGIAFALFVLVGLTFDFVKFNLDSFAPVILEPISYAVIGGACLLGLGKTQTQASPLKPKPKIQPKKTNKPK